MSNCEDPNCALPHHLGNCDDPECIGCEWVDDGPTIFVGGSGPDTADWLRREVGATVITPGLTI